MRNVSLAVASLCFVLTATASAQTLYRWTDEQGKVHYTDTPPPTNAKTSRAVTTDSAADQKAADNLRQQNDALSKRAAERSKSPDERAKEQADSDRRARCGQLLAVVNAFDRGDPVMRQGDKGERVALADKDRDFERLRSAQQLQVECPEIKPGQNPANLQGAKSSNAGASTNNAGSAGGSTTGGGAGSGGAAAGSNTGGAANGAGSARPGTSNSSQPPGSTAAPSSDKK